jgi:class 3 adenylate cyclase
LAQEIQFTGNSHSCCVCFVDVVDSTRITTVEITNAEKIKIYYSMFINTMAVIARNFGATIIKNTGDSLVYYFPATSNFTHISAFKDVLECGLTMIAVNPIINAKLKQEEGLLPPLYYRISADYGRVEVAKSLTSTTEDLFGPIVSICSKINSKAAPNEMVIGEGLYQIVKPSFEYNYIFNEIDKYSIDNNNFKHHYRVYSVANRDSNKNKNNNDTLNLYRNIIS